MIEHLIPFSNIEKFSFQQRPVSLPADLRPIWKIAQILLILRLSSRKERASVMKLQLFNWALTSDENMSRTQSLVTNEQLPGSFIVRLDPSVNRAVEFAVAEGLLDLDGLGYVVLTPKGRSLVARIENTGEVLEREKHFLRGVGLKISETSIKDLLKK